MYWVLVAYKRYAIYSVVYWKKISQKYTCINTTLMGYIGISCLITQEHLCVGLFVHMLMHCNSPPTSQNVAPFKISVVNTRAVMYILCQTTVPVLRLDSITITQNMTTWKN